MAFLPYEREIAAAGPRTSADNAYPYAAERILSLFADPTRSPDLAVVHTPRHYFPDEGGHHGEHGSLDVIQSRAPLVLAGAGVARRGYVDDHARLVDVAPTLATLAGVPREDLRDAAGAPLDGRVLDAYLDPAVTPKAVVGVLWDGAHCSDLLHLAETGELPAVARLIERGVALRGGAVAQFPSVTLTNHTSILTGTGPGGTACSATCSTTARPANGSCPTTRRPGTGRPNGCAPVRDGLRDGGDHVASKGLRARPASTRPSTAASDYSTMEADPATAAAGPAPAASATGCRPADQSPFLGDRAFLDDGYFRWGVQRRRPRPRAGPRAVRRRLRMPRLTWWANVVTDAGHHGAGPRSAMARDALRQSDARLGVFLDHLDRRSACSTRWPSC